MNKCHKFSNGIFYFRFKCINITDESKEIKKRILDDGEDKMFNKPISDRNQSFLEKNKYIVKFNKKFILYFWPFMIPIDGSTIGNSWKFS